ncbi:MAG: PIN domain-containing protein [Clostridiales bacterium]|nr:PIN domain-containing protein [Clostridiales bacterium]
MKVVFDTNVVLDVLLRRDDYEKATSLFMAAMTDKIEGVITANSITDIYYVSRKIIGDEKARSSISDLLEIFEIAPVDGGTCHEALNLQIKDFEDALVSACAEVASADYIVTRDKAFAESAQHSPVAVVTPDEMYEMICQDGHN